VDSFKFRGQNDVPISMLRIILRKICESIEGTGYWQQNRIEIDVPIDFLFGKSHSPDYLIDLSNKENCSFIVMVDDCFEPSYHTRVALHVLPYLSPSMPAPPPSSLEDRQDPQHRDE